MTKSGGEKAGLRRVLPQKSDERAKVAEKRAIPRLSEAIPRAFW
jgi:hypothetical protein